MSMHAGFSLREEMEITLITEVLYCFGCFPFFRIRRNEPSVKGTILFDANSTITVSPVNFQ